MTAAAHKLAGDVEQTAVLVTIVGCRDGREASWQAWFTVDHLGATVVQVHLPEGWRAICRNVGLDDENLDTEGYLSTLARIEFARGGR